MDNPILLHFVTVVIFCQMLAIGVNHSLRELTSLWRSPELLLRSLLAVIVLVPAVVGLLLRLFDLPPGILRQPAVNPGTVGCRNYTPHSDCLLCVV